MADQRNVTPDTRAARRETHANQTYAAFLRDLSSASGLPKDGAGRAAAAVLCALERRIMAGEAKDLESQLPRKLQDLLQGCRNERPTGDDKIGADAFVERVAADLGVSRDEAESTVRAVFTVVRAHISEGEAQDVGEQLPGDLAALWARPA